MGTVTAATSTIKALDMGSVGVGFVLAVTGYRWLAGNLPKDYPRFGRLMRLLMAVGGVVATFGVILFLMGLAQ